MTRLLLGAVLVAATAVTASLVNTAAGLPDGDGSARPPSLWPSAALRPNGAVHALALSDRTLYLAGGFDELAPHTGPFAVVARAGGKRDRAFPRIGGGSVFAIASDGRGGWFIGGDFETVGGGDCPRLAHIRGSKTVDRSWCPRPDGTVYGLLLSRDRLIVGGAFSRIGAKKRPALAALDASSGAVTGWNARARAKGDVEVGGTELYVDALATSGSVLYAGGFFSAIGGARRDSLAALDLATARATRWNPILEAPYRQNSSVGAIAVTDSTVYVGGRFKAVSGVRRNNAAALDRLTGTPTAWNPRPDGSLDAILPSGPYIYLGGFFARVDGAARPGLAAVDRRTGRITRWNPRVAGGRVAALAIAGPTLYVGGNFEGVRGLERNGLAAIAVATGRALRWDPHVSGGQVRALFVDGRSVAVGGDFSSVGPGLPRTSVAALDTATGRPRSWSVRIGGSRCTLFGCVCALAVAGSTVYLGGSFSRVGGQPRRGLAAVDATTGRVKRWNPGVRFITDGVYVLAVSGSTLYVGGDFDRVGGLPRNGLAAVNAETGRVLPWNPQPEGFESVHALGAVGSTIYAGGRFDRIGGAERHGLAALDAASGKATDWNPNPTNSTQSLFLVKSLAVSGPTVYVGGRFRQIGGKQRNGLAAVDAQTGAVLSWNPNPNDRVEALAVSASTVYAGGDFTTIAGEPRRITAVDPINGDVREWDPEIRGGGSVLALIATSSSVYAGGGFEGSVAVFRASP